MTRENIEHIIYEVLVSYITDKVVEKMTLYKKKALVVFTGSLIGFDISMENLKRLKEDGFSFHVFLSQNAKTLLDVPQIIETLQPDKVYNDLEGLPEQLAVEFETVIVPAMTINTAAKLACCIADSPATRLISGAMMRGKNVIIGIDGCCPDHEARAAKGYQMTEALKEQLRENMRKMARFGAFLTKLEDLYENTKKKQLSQKSPAFPIKAKANEAEAILLQKVIGHIDILLNQQCRVIKINKSALVTKLAEETAQKYNIQLIRE